MANWTQRKLLATIGSTASALCVAAGGGIYYTHGLIEAVEAQVAEKDQAIAAADQKIAQTPGLEKDVIILRENLDEYVKILPSEKQLSEFVRMLDRFDQQSGVHSTGLVPKPIRDAKGQKFTPIEYSYEMTATLWQCLKFMNLIENFERFVSITDFNIVSGDGGSDDTRDGDVVHKVKLTLQTYKYNGNDAAKEVRIPDYDAQRLALREEIWKRMQAIRVDFDTYEHKGEGGRRDVLIDPRERGDLRLAGPSQAEQRTVLDSYVTEVARLREMHQKTRKADTTLFEQYQLEKSLKEGLEKLMEKIETDASTVTYAPYRLRWSKEVTGPLEELRDELASGARATPIKSDPYLAMKDLQQLVADMHADCNSGQLETAKTRYDAVAGRLAVPTDDPRHALVVQARSWHHKATTALDFKALDLQIRGVVVNPSGRSGVLMNNEVYEEGDYVTEDLLLKLVEEEQVWFVFRGLTLVRTM